MKPRCCKQNNLTVQENKKLLYTVPADHIVSVSSERPGALQLLGVVLLGGELVFLLLFVFSSEVLKGIPEFFFCEKRTQTSIR